MEQEEKRGQIAPILLFAIKQKLNPGFANKNGFEHKVYVTGVCCSISEFTAMFPQAKYYPARKNPVTNKLKLVRNQKLYESKGNSVSSLDYLFKPLDDCWDILFDDDAAGFVYKIDFRLMQSTINSNRRKLCEGVAGDIEFHRSFTNTTISCTVHRSYFSRWGADGNAIDWTTKVRNEQRELIKIK